MALNISNWFQYPTNYSNGTSVDGFGKLIQWANITIGHSLSVGILLLIWVASFALALTSGVKKAVATAGFITFVFSIYLLRLGMVNGIIPILLALSIIIGLIGSKSESGGL